MQCRPEGRRETLAGEVLQEEGAANEKALGQMRIRENKEEQVRLAWLQWSRK